MQYTLEFKHISKYFPGVKALDNVSFQAFGGEVLAFLGENGAGKSTLLKTLNGDYQPDELVPEFDTNLIFRADYDGTTEKGNTQAAAVITAHPEIKTWLVTGANEEGCIGAARALESAGLDANACVVGLGGYMAKDEFKKDGGSCVKASAYFSAESVGAGSIDVLLQLIEGKEPPKETAVDAVVVTPENYVEVMGKYAE